jgi:membrane protein
LAAAATFYAFISLFPLLVIAAAVASWVAGQPGVDAVQEIVDENLPDFDLDVGEFYRNAGTISVIGAVTLTITGLGWVDSMRAAVRLMWGLDDRPGSLVIRKLADAAALIGLGLLMALSWAASGLVSWLAEEIFAATGIGGPAGRFLLTALGIALSILVNALLFAYFLTGLPRLQMPRKQLAAAAVAGAVVFEVLRQVLVGYVGGPASRNSYAAFATPLALVAWIYLITRVLMFLAAMSAESAANAVAAEAGAAAEVHAAAPPSPRTAGAAASVRAGQERAAAMAAGVVLGALGAGALGLAGRAVRAVRSAVRRSGDDR